MLSPAQQFFSDSARRFFNDQFGVEVKLTDAKEKLNWNPSMWFATQTNVTYVEVTETVIVPKIAQLTEPEINQLDVPISIYVVCPEDLFLAKETQSKIKAAVSRGYGYITVDEDGECMERYPAVPLIQIQNEATIKARIKDIKNASARRKAKAAYMRYKQDPKNGVHDLCEVVEAAITAISKKAESLTSNNGAVWLPVNTHKKTINDQVAEIGNSPQLKSQMAAFGTGHGFYSRVRNKTNHAPRSKKAAARRTRELKSDFILGLDTIDALANAARNLGLNIKV